MMTKGEFSAYVADHIKEYLSAEYGEADITIRPMRKNNDVEMTDLLIKVPEKSVTPLIHLAAGKRQPGNGSAGTRV